MDYTVAAPIAEALRKFLEFSNLGYYVQSEKFGDG
jgi:bifunctional pyridoxal-dependent enzyme with beta-cystathionase and maltose regulon repressor activities